MMAYARPADEGTLAKCRRFVPLHVLCVRRLLKKLEMEMTHVKVLLAGLVAALAVGGLAAAPGQGAQATSPSNRGIVIAHDEGTGDNTENSGNAEGSGEDSAKMGKEEGTHTGPNQGAMPENDTKKVDQTERRNPTTGGEGDDSKE